MPLPKKTGGPLPPELSGLIKLYKHGVDVDTTRAVAIAEKALKLATTYYADDCLSNKVRRRIDIEEWAATGRGIISDQELSDLTDELKIISHDITKDIPGMEHSEASEKNLVIASAKSTLASAVVRDAGPTHRDCPGVEDEGLLVCEMALTPVTLTNGTVKLYHNTTHTPCDPKHPNREVEKMTTGGYEYMIADKGDIMVWDARILHQSMANVTGKLSCKLHWFIEGDTKRPSQRGSMVQEVEENPVELQRIMDRVVASNKDNPFGLTTTTKHNRKALGREGMFEVERRIEALRKEERHNSLPQEGVYWDTSGSKRKRSRTT